jgi:hypothetical protein
MTALYWFLAWFVLRPLTCKPCVPPKCRLYFTGLHSVLSQKVNFFVITDLRTWDPTDLLYQPWMIDDGDCGALGRMKIGRVNRSTGRKSALAPPCPQQIPRDLTRARIWAASVGSRQLTTSAMARPQLVPCVTGKPNYFPAHETHEAQRNVTRASPSIRQHPMLRILEVLRSNFGQGFYMSLLANSG